MTIRAQNRVLQAIVQERDAQDKKWGEQNHPDLSPSLTRTNLLTPAELSRTGSHSRRWWLANVARYYGVIGVEKAKEYCDTEHKAGQGSWFSIHIEELTEALEAAALGDTEALRIELVQLAATVTAHVEAIDRRGN